MDPDVMVAQHSRHLAQATGGIVAAVWFLTAGLQTMDENVADAMATHEALGEELGMKGNQDPLTYTRGREFTARVLESCLERLRKYEEGEL